MYSNIVINGFRFLSVEINDRLYVLGCTGRAGDCQDLSTMRLP